MSHGSDDETDHGRRDDGARRSGRDAADGKDEPANVAPDAVRDPNEKTGGKPGVPPGSQGDETDPGGS